MKNHKVPKDSSYYNNLYMPLMKMVRPGYKRVLEIGCASGLSLSYLKDCGADLTVGVELVPEIAKVAEARPEVDKVIVGSIENLQLDYPEGYFDLILASHVLEHLVDPWISLKKLTGYLRPGGQFLGAVPNVQHHSVVLPLLFKGEWRYTDQGIMDWTHLRFFTRDSVQELLTSAGLEIDVISRGGVGRKGLVANALTLSLFQELFTSFHDFSATKPL